MPETPLLREIVKDRSDTLSCLVVYFLINGIISSLDVALPVEIAEITFGVRHAQEITFFGEVFVKLAAICFDVRLGLHAVVFGEVEGVFWDVEGILGEAGDFS